MIKLAVEIQLSLIEHNFTQSRFATDFVCNVPLLDNTTTKLTMKIPFWDGRKIVKKSILLLHILSTGSKLQHMRWLSHHRNHRCWNYCSRELWRRDENWLYLSSCKGVIFVCSHEIKMIKSVQFVHSGPISPSHSESRSVKCYQFCNELMIKSLQLLLVKHFRSNFLCSFQFPMQRFFIESFKWKWIWHFRANLNFQLFLWLLTCIMRKVKFMKNYGFLI